MEDTVKHGLIITTTNSGIFFNQRYCLQQGDKSTRFYSLLRAIKLMDFSLSLIGVAILIFNSF